MAFSSIKRKPCKKEDCPRPPKMGCKGYCSLECMPDEMRENETKKTVEKRANQFKAQISKKLHLLDNGSKKEISAEFKALVASGDTKSTLLGIADKTFSLFIRKRDCDKDGFIECVCCGGRFHIDQKDNNGDKVVQCLHFVVRTVYSLRFSEIACHAGCGWCNNDMDKNPKGLAYKQFRKYLVACIGEMDVREMESARRNINKLTEGDLRDIIKKYSPVNHKTNQIC